MDDANYEQMENSRALTRFDGQYCVSRSSIGSIPIGTGGIVFQSSVVSNGFCVRFIGHALIETYPDWTVDLEFGM